MKKKDHGDHSVDLPTIEELKALSDASFIASGSVSHTSPGFVASGYWSDTVVASTPANAYSFYMNLGVTSSGNSKATSIYVRCVQ